MTTRTKVAVTATELSPGVPDWTDHHVNVTEVPLGATKVAFENLIAGRRYYVKSWNEDQFGNKSPELVRVVDTAQPTRPQTIPIATVGVFDDGSPMYAFVRIPADATPVSAAITLSFRQFFASARDAAASGTLTSDSGGGSTSGASSSGSSGAKHLGLTLASDTVDISAVAGATGPASTGTAHTHTGGTLIGFGEGSFVTDISDHDHTIAHTHSTPDHAHTVPTHTHALTYGTFEESYPASHSVTVTTYKRDAAAWTLMNTSASLTDDLADLDLSAVITSAGDWRIEVLSDAAQPNGGRLGCDLYGSVEVTR